MKQVDVFVTASIRGPARGTGRVMYIMRTQKKSGGDYESKPAIAEYDEATESRLVLYAVRDALQRLKYDCRVTIYTESLYIKSVLENHWLEEWERKGWKNAKGKEIQDSILWSQIYQLLDETGHELTAEHSSHEFTQWMRWKMQLVHAYKDVFWEVKEN